MGSHSLQRLKNPYWSEVNNPGFWIHPLIVAYYFEQKKKIKTLKGGGDGA